MRHFWSGGPPRCCRGDGPLQDSSATNGARSIADRHRQSCILTVLVYINPTETDAPGCMSSAAQSAMS